MRLTRTLLRAAFSMALLTVLASWEAPAGAQASPEEAAAIGVDAYLYFYPLVTMDVTRKQLTNVEAGTGGLGGPPNTFVNIPAYPTADMKAVVRPNFDTLYSSAWLDLSAEPVIVSVPDTNGRYSAKNLPPGDDYLIIAVQNLEQGQGNDPEFLLRARDDAKPFSLNDGETKAVDVRLSAINP